MKEKVKEFLCWLFLCNHCKYCGVTIKRNEEICQNCSENLPRIADERCKYCGAEKSRCNCKNHKNMYDGITAPFYYEGIIAKRIVNFKFCNYVHLAKPFAKDMAESVRNDFKKVDFDFVCYVPFNKSTKRRYNQSELLARNIAEELNTPLKPVMVKIVENKPQHHLDIVRRRGNVVGVYDVCDDVNGKVILLVDDIKTSGATMDSCATILKIRGAEKVYGVALALAGVKADNKK